MKRKKILIVDDEPCIRRTLKYFLRQHGFDVSTVTNGEEALVAINANRPDLIFLDYMMPGMNGLEVCRKIKQNPELSEIIVILLTSTRYGLIQGQSMSRHVDEYMAKPFSPSRVLRTIKKFLQ